MRVRSIVALVAPPACVACRAACDAASSLCARCERELARGSARSLHVPAVDTAWAARPYEGVVRELVTAIKFRKLLPAAARAADVIADEAQPDLLGGAIVPVPADPVRAAWRGFDPAEVLARHLAARTGLPLSTCLRRSHGARQVGRSRHERLAAPPRVVADGTPRSALLVDDVSTTGATLAAAAAALRSTGCERVAAIVFAAARS